MKNTIKYIARLLVETATPIAIGSGEKGLEVDRLIIRDANGLPYIPGSSLAGVIRHELDADDTNEAVKALFGYQRIKAEIAAIAKETHQKKEGIQTGQGSRIAFSPAKLLGEDGKTVIEGLQNIDLDKGYYSYFNKLPERDHVKITHKGVANDKSKFDEQLVPKGTRFVFEIELSGTKEDESIWGKLLNTLHQPFFRIGAGTRNGFGKLNILACKTKVFDLKQEHDLLDYLQKSSSLNGDYTRWNDFKVDSISDENWVHYQLRLAPENFFLFGAGFGDEDADNKQKTERYIEWIDGKPVMEEAQTKVLIPATSVKGAISHRVAYHYNWLEKTFIHQTGANEFVTDLDAQVTVNKFDYGVQIDAINLPSDAHQWEELKKQVSEQSFDRFLENSIDWLNFKDDLDEEKDAKEETSLPIFENNEAVRTLFGYAKDEKNGARGQVILSDIYLDYNKTQEKVFSHVAIDRFTGGGIDGALFQEKVIQAGGFTLDIYVSKEALQDQHIKQSFENTLDDLVNGKLQLGGNTTKGHGAFTISF